MGNEVDICNANQVHESAKGDPLQWAQLPFLGVQDDGCGGGLELRNCDRCGSTIGIEVRS